LGIQTISFACAVRDIQPRVHPQFAEEQEQLRTTGHSIDIIISVDIHLLALGTSA
jgi:hypothetical protein